MRGYELLNFISDDEELYQLVLEFVIWRQQVKRRGRKGKPERKATREFEHFWKSLEGAKFRFILERKLGGETAIRVVREGNARRAMILLIAEIQWRLES